MTSVTAESAAPFAVNTDAAAVRRQMRKWLDENWDPEISLLEWRRRLVDGGWAVPTWAPHWYGRGLPQWADGIVLEELNAVGAVGLPPGSGVRLASATILAHGPDSLRTRFLRALLTGEERWCQLFSEPGAGSDLAGLTTRAVIDGDRWIVNGQKVWNTSAHRADFGLLIARTDWDVPKHRGLTYMALPMHQSGVEVRPLRQMNGYSSFNEVFLSDAHVPTDFVIGGIGAGWSVALTTLAHERRFVASAPVTRWTGNGRAVVEARLESEEHQKTYEWYPQRAGRVDLVVDHARQAGLADQPLIRQQITKLISLQRVSEWTAARSRAVLASGREPGAEGSIGKLSNSRIAKLAASVHSLIAGASGMLTNSDGPYSGAIAQVLMSVPAQSIAGGTDEIQKNIIGEKVLGLPREPAPTDNDISFRKTLHA